MPEGLEYEILQKQRYINPLIFAFTFTVWLSTVLSSRLRAVLSCTSITNYYLAPCSLFVTLQFCYDVCF